METECKNGSTVYGIYVFYRPRTKTWQRCDSDVSTDMFILCSTTIKEVLIKMKTIFLWLCMSVDNETVSLKVRL